jgi:5,10-methylenetetrahydromethanopterin reductase
MAAEGPRTLKLAGEIADAVLVHTGLTPEILESSIAMIREGEDEAGKPQGSVEIWAFAKCNVADDRDEATQEIKMALAASGHHAFRYTLEGKHVPEDLHESVAVLQREYEPMEHEQLGHTRNATLSDELGLTDFLADRFAVVGTPEECREKVAAIAKAGVDVLLATAIGPKPDVIIERFGREVAALSG